MTMLHRLGYLLHRVNDACHTPGVVTRRYRFVDRIATHLYSRSPKGPQANLGMATTQQLIEELAARASVSESIGETWPSYSTVRGRDLPCDS